RAEALLDAFAPAPVEHACSSEIQSRSRPRALTQGTKHHPLSRASPPVLPRARCPGGPLTCVRTITPPRSPAGGSSVKTFPTAKIRNVALVGHGGAGKTSLAEALLFNAGAIVRLGRVEDGTTVCDFDPEEQRRRISVSLALAPFELDGTKVNVLDTRGYADFVGDVGPAFQAAALAL